MKTLEQYSKLIKDNIQNPVILAELGEEISADYAYYCDQIKDIKLKKPKIWTDIKRLKDGKEREKYLSDKLTEECWRTLPEGQKEIELKYKLKGLEKMASAVKSHLIILNREYQLTNDEK